MNSKGMTLTELMIVIIILGILATVTTMSISGIAEKQRMRVDKANAEFLGETISLAYMEGNLIIQDGRLYNTTTERAYTGTGTWFYDDMGGYIKNRIVPQATEAQNNYNANGGTYRFLFSVSGQEVTIFYYDTNRDQVILHTFTLENY